MKYVLNGFLRKENSITFDSIKLIKANQKTALKIHIRLQACEAEKMLQHPFGFFIFYCLNLLFLKK
ncbi:hypothetical protein MB14_16395 [Roseivirga ehrenbergii]|uniref:Uncharacterized protein n=1 Tax=Roseivirga ehrenbergii (strain DSM 102268 / JCM 13514 / KCTC 12282 / NCIMB 14502 / KMM 6017) TaxID=279360 RepID=A0A150XN12_ROSEK|nr:hypothetical protein MB14_16395 [Roseivirga ehrenbergii]